jgi:thiol:disulfide interchange protein DsbA
MLRTLLQAAVLCFFATATQHSIASANEVVSWKAGKHYEIIQPGESKAPANKPIEVTEFIWLGCPHCRDLEPYVERWASSQTSKSVVFRRVAVGWDKPERRAHARLFFALQALNREDIVPTVFETIQAKKNRLYVDKDEAKTLALLRAFANENRLDATVLLKAYQSPEAFAYIERANQEAVAMHVPGVPSVGVNGRYITDRSRVGSPEELFELVNYLVAQERARTATAAARK